MPLALDTVNAALRFIKAPDDDQKDELKKDFVRKCNKLMDDLCCKRFYLIDSSAYYLPLLRCWTDRLSNHLLGHLLIADYVENSEQLQTPVFVPGFLDHHGQPFYLQYKAGYGDSLVRSHIPGPASDNSFCRRGFRINTRPVEHYIEQFAFYEAYSLEQEALVGNELRKSGKEIWLFALDKSNIEQIAFTIPAPELDLAFNLKKLFAVFFNKTSDAYDALPRDIVKHVFSFL